MTEQTTICVRCGLTISYPEMFCSNCGAATPSQAWDDISDTTERLQATPPAEAESPGETKPAPKKLKLDEPEPEPEAEAGPVVWPGGVSFDWEPAFVARVEDAAELEEITFEEFVRAAVERAAKRVLDKPRGLVSLDAAAAALGLPRTDIVKQITAGKLRARKVEGEWMIEQASLGDVPMGPGNVNEQIELELSKLVETAGLQGVDTSGDAPAAATATVCYVNQDAILVCPQAAWRKLGRNRIVAEARDAVRRYKRRADRDLGRI